MSDGGHEEEERQRYFNDPRNNVSVLIFHTAQGGRGSSGNTKFWRLSRGGGEKGRNVNLLPSYLHSKVSWVNSGQGIIN